MTTTSGAQELGGARMSGTVDSLDLAVLDPAGRDERRLQIEAEHPMLRQALDHGVDGIGLDGKVMDSTLPIALHEVVAERPWTDDAAETWSTAQWLSALGYGQTRGAAHAHVSACAERRARRRRRR